MKIACQVGMNAARKHRRKPTTNQNKIGDKNCHFLATRTSLLCSSDMKYKEIVENSETTTLTQIIKPNIKHGI